MKQKSSLQVLVFKIHGQFFALETRYIKEIVENVNWIKLPLETEHITHIIIYRNNAYGVLNPDYYFGMKEENPEFFIILDDYIALPVKEIGGLFFEEQFEKIREDTDSIFIKKILYINEKPIMLLNYEEINSHEGKAILFPI